MHILCLGIDHISAPLALRERLACSEHYLLQLLHSGHASLRESVLLSTCQRLEWYVACEETDTALAQLRLQFSEAGGLSSSELTAHTYTLSDQQAVLHLFSVTSGLLSIIPGEPQIQEQVARALSLAQQARCAGPITSALFRAALVTGKRARNETDISRHTVSLSHVAVQLACQTFAHLAEASILLLGSGHMNELTAQHLRASGARNLTIINRTPLHANMLAERVGATTRTLAELPDALHTADVVIASTAAPHALVTYEMMQEVVRLRQGRPMLLIDMALPRDIEPRTAELPGVRLANLADLRAAADEGLRPQEVEQVEVIVNAEADSFARWLASLSVIATISELHNQADTLREQELARTLNQLAPSLSARESAAIQELTTRLVNKLLYLPTRRLKDAATSEEGARYAEAVRYVFGLHEYPPQGENYLATGDNDIPAWNWDPMRVHP